MYSTLYYRGTAVFASLGPEYSGPFPGKMVGHEARCQRDFITIGIAADFV